MTAVNHNKDRSLLDTIIERYIEDERKVYLLYYSKFKLLLGKFLNTLLLFIAPCSTDAGISIYISSGISSQTTGIMGFLDILMIYLNMLSLFHFSTS
jgi:hypothetical protein